MKGREMNVSYLEDVAGGDPLTAGDNPRANDSSRVH